MERFFTKPWLRVYSGLFINFAYGYFALGFITPNFTQQKSIAATLGLLTWNIISGILFLLASVKVEQMLEEYE